MPKLGIGIIGCGGLGSNLCRHLLTIENAELVAGADISAEQRAKFKAEFGVPVYADNRRLLGNPRIGAVLVVTPNDSHERLTIRALEVGKHVYCEKPMAMSVAQCDRMIATADRKGLKLMVGQVLRLFPSSVKAREIADSGSLGRPFGVFIARTGAPRGFLRSWRPFKRKAGGLLLELNVHELDLMRHLMGEVEAVSAQMGHFLDNDLEYEDLVFVELRFRSGAMGVLYSSLASAIGTHHTIVQCTEGTITCDAFRGPIRYAKFGEEPETIASEDIQGEDPYRCELRSFVDAVLTGSPMVFDGRDGRAAVEIVQAAYLSAKRGRPVRLPL